MNYGGEAGQYYQDMGDAAEAEAMAAMNAKAQAEYEYQQSLTPNTPLQVLTLFDADKKALQFYEECIELEVKEGRENALRIETIAKKTIKTMEGILSRIKQNSINEAEKYGEKPFMYGNCEVHYTATKTEYDYSACGYPEWEEADANEISAKANKKRAEEFLKAVKEPFTMVDTRTGEVVTITPPIKKQWMGVKVSIK